MRVVDFTEFKEGLIENEHTTDCSEGDSFFTVDDNRGIVVITNQLNKSVILSEEDFRKMFVLMLEHYEGKLGKL